MGLFKFGFVTIYLSEPLTRALTFGASIHVFSSQIKHVFGVKVGRYSGPFSLIYVCHSAPHIITVFVWNSLLGVVGSLYWESSFVIYPLVGLQQSFCHYSNNSSVYYHVSVYERALMVL